MSGRGGFSRGGGGGRGGGFGGGRGGRGGGRGGFQSYGPPAEVLGALGRVRLLGAGNGEAQCPQA